MIVIAGLVYAVAPKKCHKKCQNPSGLRGIGKQKTLSGDAAKRFLSASGATRKCYPLRNELASNILERRKKVCTLHCTLTIFGAFHYFSLRLSLRKDKY